MAFLFYKSQKPNFHEELTVLNLGVCGRFKYIWISVLPFKLHNLFSVSCVEISLVYEVNFIFSLV